MYKLIATSNEEMRKYEGQLLEVRRGIDGRLYASNDKLEGGGFVTSQVMTDIEHDDIRFVVTHHNTYVFRKE